MKLRVIFLISFLGLIGCSHALHQYQVTEYDQIRTANFKRISAQAEQHTVLGFIDQTNYVDEAHDKLMRKCPNGKITSINTRYSTSHGFLSWTNTIKLTAYCVN